VRASARGGYTASLAYAGDAGKLKSLEWRSSVAPSGTLQRRGAEQRAFRRPAVASGRCSVTCASRDYVRVSAENCGELCARRRISGAAHRPARRVPPAAAETAEEMSR